MLARIPRRWQVLVDNTPIMRMVCLWICIMEKPYTRPQEYGSGVQEAARHDAGRLAGEERPPGRHAGELAEADRTKRAPGRNGSGSVRPAGSSKADWTVLSACHTVTVSKIRTFP